MQSTTSAKPSLLDVYDELASLRPMPVVANQVIVACNADSISARELSELIECDIALSVRLVQTANSPLYGMGGEIKSVQHAAVILGRRALRDMAITIASAEVFASGNPASQQARKALWDHSVASGVAAKLLAARTNAVVPEEAFLAGIVHDVGKLIFYDYDTDRYAHIQAVSKSTTAVQVEEEEFGIAHPCIGQKCGDDWGLPDDITEGILFHHDPKSADVFGDLPPTLFAANQLAKLWTGDSDDDLTSQAHVVLDEVGFGLTSDEITELHGEFQTGYEALRQVFAA